MGSGVFVRVSSTVSYGGKEDRCAGFGRLPLLIGVFRPELGKRAESITCCGTAFSGISPSLSTVNVLDEDVNSRAAARRIGLRAVDSSSKLFG